jgi:hypothetical protein
MKRLKMFSRKRLSARTQERFSDIPIVEYVHVSKTKVQPYSGSSVPEDPEYGTFYFNQNIIRINFEQF